MRRYQQIPNSISHIPEFPNHKDGLTLLPAFSDIDDEWHDYHEGQQCYTEAHASEYRAWAEPVLAGVPLQEVGPIVEVVNQGNDTWVVAKYVENMVSEPPTDEKKR